MANRPDGSVERLDGRPRSGTMTVEDADPPVYRCYFLDDRGRMATAAVIERTDDTSAIRDAVALLNRRNHGGRLYAGIELWDRARLVHASQKPPIGGA